MPLHIEPVEVFDLVIFGATGDLTQRKILPAMFHRDVQGQILPDARIIGTSRKTMTDDEFKAFAQAALEKFVEKEALTPDALARFLGRLSYVTAEATIDDGWPKLEAVLAPNQDRVRVFYLAVGPDLFGPICARLGQHNLVTPKSRVVVEKPLGRDGASAEALNTEIGKVFAEPAIFRIDHYLGKETVQNMMALRFANRLFEPLWNTSHIDHVQITVAETLGVESRAGYYDTAGALRDMVQNHMLQLLCLLTMEPPASIWADDVRNEKLQVLQSLKPMTREMLERNVIRGQYVAGTLPTGPVPGYLQELGNTTSQTETFVAMKLEISNWRWGGVPFYFRTGKRLAKHVSEIMVQFKDVPHNLFADFANPPPHLQPNRLVLRLQPDESVQLWLLVKEPGPGGFRFKYVPLDMNFATAFNERQPEAYERLIMDVVRGNQTLFMRRDEVAAAWKFIDPILAYWKNSTEGPKQYAAGTWGPSAALALIARDDRDWYDDDGAP